MRLVGNVLASYWTVTNRIVIYPLDRMLNDFVSLAFYYSSLLFEKPRFETGLACLTPLRKRCPVEILPHFIFVLLKILLLLIHVGEYL